MPTEQEIIRRAMSIMGSRTSPEKTRACRENARLGGAPRLYTYCIDNHPFHRFSRSGICYRCRKDREECRLNEGVNDLVQI